MTKKRTKIACSYSRRLELCPKCGSQLDYKVGDAAKLICSNPKCKHVQDSD